MNFMTYSTVHQLRLSVSLGGVFLFGEAAIPTSSEVLSQIKQKQVKGEYEEVS